MPFYESAGALQQYLFFHYGAARDYLPFPGAPRDALYYPVRAVRELIDRRLLPRTARALDLGCATGATSFELSRYCREVVGIDLSRSFIRAANRMKRQGRLRLSYPVEGDRRGQANLKPPAGAHPGRISFRVGDAMKLKSSLGLFDVAVLLNLIDRVPDPAACLMQVAGMLPRNGQLIIASPYTWLEEYTPRSAWLGGKKTESTREALTRTLGPSFRLARTRQIPFLIREHARKYQWSMAEGTCWIKRG